MEPAGNKSQSEWRYSAFRKASIIRLTWRNSFYTTEEGEGEEDPP